MEDNIFIKERKNLKLADYMQAQRNGRENLGSELPVAVYRLLEYSIREELTEQFGKEEQIRIFRNAGYRAGVYFAEKYPASERTRTHTEQPLRSMIPL